MVETEREWERDCRRHAYVLKKKRWDRGQERTECKKSAWKRQRNEKRISNYLVLSLVLCYLVLVVFIFYLQNDDWLLTGFSILYLLSFLLYSLHVNMGFFFHHSLSLSFSLSLSVCFFLVFVILFAWNSSHFQVRCVMAFSLRMVILTLFVNSTVSRSFFRWMYEK